MQRVGKGPSRVDHSPRNQPSHLPSALCLWWGDAGAGGVSPGGPAHCLRSPSCAGVSQEEDAGRILTRPHGGGDVKAQGCVFKGSNHIVKLFIVLSF